MKKTALFIGLAVWTSMVLGSSGCKRDTEPSPVADKMEPVEAATPATDPSPHGSDDTEAEGKAFFAEEIGDNSVVPMAAPGFQSLELTQKQYVWHLFEAARAMDALYYAESGRSYPYIRRILYHVSDLKGGVPGVLIGKLNDYARQFWLHRGNVDLHDGSVLTPRFIPGELAAAAQAAIKGGADLGQSDLKELDLGATRLDELFALLELVKPALFDIRANGKKESIPVDSEQIAQARGQLTAALNRALAVAEPGSKEALERLLGPFEAHAGVGEEELPPIRVPAQKGWNGRLPTAAVFWHTPERESGAPERTLVGVEVALKDEARSEMIGRLAVRPGEFEFEMPGESRFNRATDNVNVPIPAAYRLIAASGISALEMPPTYRIVDQGRGWPAAYVYFVNSAEAFLSDLRLDLYSRLMADENVWGRLVKWHEQARFVFENVKGVLGPASGKRSPLLKNMAADPKRAQLADTIEALHGDLVALHLSYGKLLRDRALVPSEDCARSVIDAYVLSYMADLGLGLEQGTPGWMARSVVLGHALDKAALVTAEIAAGTVLSVADYALMQQAVAELLGEVRSIRARGDLDAARKLFRKYRALPEAPIAITVKRLAADVQWPERLVPGYPLFVPNKDADGQISDVEVVPYQSIRDLEGVHVVAFR